MYPSDTYCTVKKSLFFSHTLGTWKVTTKEDTTLSGAKRGDISSLGRSRMFLTSIPDSLSVPLISLKENSFATCRSLVKAVSFKCCLEQSCPKACIWYSWTVTWLSQVCRLLKCKPADVIQSRKSPSHLHWLIDFDGLLCLAKWFWTREHCCNLKNFRKSPCPRLHTPQDSEEKGEQLQCWSAKQDLAAWSFCYWVLAPVKASGELGSFGTGLLCLTDASCLLKLSAFFPG